MPENEEKNSSTEKDFQNKLTKEMTISTKQWGIIVSNLTKRITSSSLKDIVEVQAEAISHRQTVIEEIKIYSVRIHKLVQKMKVLTKAKFEFYATSYQVKTSGTEKLNLINSDLSEYQCFINELDEHVNFLRDTSKNLESISFSIKNRIEIDSILGGYR
jgi:hypothetical protein